MLESVASDPELTASYSDGSMGKASSLMGVSADIGPVFASSKEMDFRSVQSDAEGNGYASLSQRTAVCHTHRNWGAGLVFVGLIGGGGGAGVLAVGGLALGATVLGILSGGVALSAICLVVGATLLCNYFKGLITPVYPNPVTRSTMSFKDEIDSCIQACGQEKSQLNELENLNGATVERLRPVISDEFEKAFRRDQDVNWNGPAMKRLAMRMCLSRAEKHLEHFQNEAGGVDEDVARSVGYECATAALNQLRMSTQLHNCNSFQTANEQIRLCRPNAKPLLSNLIQSFTVDFAKHQTVRVCRDFAQFCNQVDSYRAWQWEQNDCQSRMYDEPTEAEVIAEAIGSSGVNLNVLKNLLNRPEHPARILHWHLGWLQSCFEGTELGVEFDQLKFVCESICQAVGTELISNVKSSSVDNDDRVFNLEIAQELFMGALSRAIRRDQNMNASTYIQGDSWDWRLVPRMAKEKNDN